MKNYKMIIFINQFKNPLKLKKNSKILNHIKFDDLFKINIYTIKYNFQIFEENMFFLY